MAEIELNAASSLCRRCGRAYGRLKGYFPASYAELYKGVGYLPYCWDCVNKMYAAYYKEAGDEAKATERLCRKLDLYWNREIYDATSKRRNNRTTLVNYFVKLSNMQNAGKCYDDTLRERSGLLERPPVGAAVQDEAGTSLSNGNIEITDEIKAFWGPGYTPDTYQELEQRLRYYKEKMGDGILADMETEARVRQIVMMEIDINRARAAGMSVDKMASSLNSMLSALNKSNGRGADSGAGGTPFGVWIKRWEDERPIPEIDDSLKDVDGITKYILTWVYGHLAHMLKLKNANTKLYDEEVARLRVERPEYDDEDDEVLLDDIYGLGDGDGHER